MWHSPRELEALKRQLDERKSTTYNGDHAQRAAEQVASAQAKAERAEAQAAAAKRDAEALQGGTSSGSHC
jgi:hypothetical protein